jgi:hypothetical protein
MQGHSKEIPGYAYGADTVETSSISLKELQELKVTVGLREEDERYLRLAGEVLVDQVKQVVEHWRSRIIAIFPTLRGTHAVRKAIRFRNISRKAINRPCAVTRYHCVHPGDERNHQAVLGGEGTVPTDVDEMHLAWCKSLQLQVALWTHTYTKRVPNEW